MTSIEKLCVEKGLKMTAPRRVIARVLSSASNHPDAEEVHRRAVKFDDRISLATVYRTLRLFEEQGILARRDFGDGRARFETEASRHHHDHLIDLQSGRVVEFENDEIEELQAKLARRLGYRLVSHRLQLYGVPLRKGK
jgi:Fur family ferric uptake transcriptional regulator